MIIGLIVQLIWSQLCDISFLIVNSFVSISLPGTPSVIQAVMIKYVNFDILYTELWIDEFMKIIGLNLDGIENDGAISVEFENNGFFSKQFLKNAGPSLILLFLYLFGWLNLVLLTFISNLL
jgi:hypothetical protein